MSITRIQNDFEHHLVKVDAAEATTAIDHLIEQQKRWGVPVSTRFYLAPPIEGESRSPHEMTLRERGFRPLCWSVVRRWYGGQGGQIGAEVWLGPAGEVTVEVGAPTTEWDHPAGMTIPSVHFTDGHRLVLWPADHVSRTGDTTDLIATDDFGADLEIFCERLEELRAAGRVPIRVTDLATVQKLDVLRARRMGADTQGIVLFVFLIAFMGIFAAFGGLNLLLTPAWLAVPLAVLWRLLGIRRPRPADVPWQELLAKEDV